MTRSITLLLVLGLSLSASTDIQYQKAELYTLSKLFAPMCEYCDSHIATSQQKYIKSYNAWLHVNAQNISEGKHVAHQIIEQLGTEPEHFYQQQVIEVLKGMATQSPEQLILSCDQLRAKLHRFTESPLLAPPQPEQPVGGSH